MQLIYEFSRDKLELFIPTYKGVTRDHTKKGADKAAPFFVYIQMK